MTRRRALLVNVGHGHGHAGGGEAHPRHHVAPMDLGLAAALLEGEGWHVDLWDTQTQPDVSSQRIARLAVAKAPDLAIIRAVHGTTPVAAELGRQLALVTPTRLGMGPALQPYNRTLVAADGEGEGGAPLSAVLVGEPEDTLRALLPALREAVVQLPHVPGLWTASSGPVPARPLISDLDALPLPSQHLLMGQGYQFRYPLDVRGRLRIGYSLTSRGCALSCLFCAPIERESYGTKYRWRSPDNVCDELELLRSLGANAVYFIDDFFAFSNKRVAALCERMLECDVVLPWAAQVRAQGLPLELLKLMRRAGCSTLCYGAESGSNRVLKLLSKGVTVEQVRAQSALMARAGIQQVGYFIVGVPSETAAERALTYQLIEDLAPDVVQLHIFNVFEGAPAHDDVRFAGHYQEDATKFTGPARLNPALQALDRERRRFYRRYYLDPGYLQRQVRRRFWPLLSNAGAELAFARRSARFFFGRDKS